MRAISTGLMASLLFAIPAAFGVEVNGRSSFVAVPTQTELINYESISFSGGAVFYLVLKMPKGADAGLAEINFSQIRGAQPAFYYGPVQPTAFLGRPRHEGKSLPVSAEFSDDNRSVAIRFQDPVVPGETVTVAFRIGVNPPADIYTFSVSATPWGQQPIAQTVGVVQMSIYENTDF